MDISIITGGSRGDVQPYIALGKGLREAGHAVRLVATDDFETLTTAAGLEFRSTGGSIEQILQSDEWRNTIEGGNFLTIVRQMRKELQHHAERVAQKTPGHVAGSDLIVSGMAGLLGGFSIAEKLNIPIMQAHVLPITPTRAFPSPLTPHMPFGRLLNPLSFHVMRQMIWQSGRTGDVTTRRVLGMKKGSFWGPYRSLKRRGVPAVYGYSRHVLPAPDDWPDNHHVTGYWYLDAADDWSPPADLVDFIQAGSPPVYIGFGSMGSRDPEAVAQVVLKALERAGQRGILASGWGGMNSAELPDTVYRLSSAPHSWLFPQMAAVVHHGGAGTTAAGLRAGVPSIVAPFMADQPYWGWRIAQLGVGTPPIPKKKLTSDKLADAITQVVTDSALRQRAADLGERIRNEDGVTTAVTWIERLSGG